MVRLSIVVVTAGQFAFTYLPPLQAVFATQAVPFFDGVIVFCIGVALFAIIEIETTRYVTPTTDGAPA